MGREERPIRRVQDLMAKRTFTHVLDSKGRPVIVDEKTTMPKGKYKAADFEKVRQPKTLLQRAARNLFH